MRFLTAKDYFDDDDEFSAAGRRLCWPKESLACEKTVNSLLFGPPSTGTCWFEYLFPPSNFPPFYTSRSHTMNSRSIVDHKPSVDHRLEEHQNISVLYKNIRCGALPQMLKQSPWSSAIEKGIDTLADTDFRPHRRLYLLLLFWY